MFSTPVLRRYLYSLSARGLRPRTIHGLFDPLRGLGNFLVDNGVLTANPVLALKMPKKDAAQCLTISREEIAALLEALERQRDPRHTALSRAILHTLVFCGLRAQECLDLKVAHVSLDNKTLLVASGKGRKSRMLYPSPECLAALSEWLLVREADCTHDWLWAEDRGRRVGYEGLRQMLEEIKCLAGLRDHANIKCHSIRHFFATHLLERGATIKQIQAAMGHSMAQTTFVYLHLGEAESKAMADLASLDAPRGAPVTSHAVPPQNPPTPLERLSPGVQPT